MPDKLKWKELILGTIAVFNKNKMSVYSGNATLFIITAAFPFIMLIISVVNLLPGYSPKDVLALLFQIMPDLEPIRSLLESMVINLKEQSGGLLASAAAVTTLWSASVGVSAIQKGLNQLDPDGRESGVRTIVKRLLFTVILIVLIPALLMFEMLGSSLEEIINAILDKLNLDRLEIIKSTIASVFQISSVLVIIFALLAILLIYAYLPVTRSTMKSCFPGALLTLVCGGVFTELFAIFIPKIYKASNLYGSLAALFLLLLWLRFVIMILFAGAALNRTISESKRLRGEAEA